MAIRLEISETAVATSSAAAIAIGSHSSSDSATAAGNINFYMPSDETPSPEEDEPAMTARAWAGPIAFEDQMTGDNRVFAPGAINWLADSLPMPFRWVRADSGKHDSAVVIGRVDHLARTADGAIMADGVIFDGPDAPPEARQYLSLLANGAAGGVSIDADESEFTVIEAPAPDGGMSVQQHFSNARLRSLTAVDIPAFVHARIHLSDGMGESHDSGRLLGEGQPGDASGMLALDRSERVRPTSRWSSVRFGVRRGRSSEAPAQEGPSCGLGAYAGSDPRGPDDRSPVPEQALLQSLSHGIGERGGEHSARQHGETLAVAGDLWVWAPIHRSEHANGSTPSAGWFRVQGADMPVVSAESERGVRATSTDFVAVPVIPMEMPMAANAECSCGEHLIVAASKVPWNGAAGQYSDAQYKTATAGCDSGDGTTKERCFLPHHEPGGTLNINGLHAAAQRATMLKNRSPAAVASAKAHLRAHYREVGEEAPPSIQATLEAIVASAIPVEPPDEWFENPHLDGPTPITVTADGHVYGHLALKDTCHIAQAQCVTPPKGSTYAYFHTGELITAGGQAVAVGHMTFGTGHAALADNALAAASHYDNTGTVGADVRAGEDEHGIWLSGALRSTLSDEDIRIFRSAPPSGDWRRIGGRLELVAVLAVNTPGFPVPRTRARVLVASGQQQAVIAAVPPDDFEPSEVQRQAMKDRLNNAVVKSELGRRVAGKSGVVGGL